ncbi:MAG: class II fructose-bisphosphate aldolase, partial [Micavibrio aeruginosavorus]
KKQYDPRVWLREGEKGIIARMDEAFADLRSAGKSLAQ